MEKGNGSVNNLYGPHIEKKEHTRHTLAFRINSLIDVKVFENSNQNV